MKNSIPMIFASVLLGACGTAQSIPDSESPAARTFVARCSGCHALPHPARHTEQQWQHLVTLMERRMAERAYSPLSASERAEILTYLSKNAR